MSTWELFLEEHAIETLPSDEQIEVCMEATSREDNRIKDVHVLGLNSKNSKRGKSYGYSETAVKEAISLYEGIDVYLNHAEKDNAPRDIRDKIGFIENVQYKEGIGLKGDLVLNEKHEFYEQLIWWADNRPSQLGLSHHAGGTFNRSTGLCESIRVVRSVDIVTKPATTEGLFESVKEGMIEDALKTDKLRKHFAEVIEKSISMFYDNLYSVDLLQAKADAVRLIAEDLVTIMRDFGAPNAELNPDLTESQEDDMDWKDITLEALLEHREDLVTAIRDEERTVLEAHQQKLEESLKDVPEKLVNEFFMEQCKDAIASNDDEKLHKLIEDRKSLLGKVKAPTSTPARPTTESFQESHTDEFDLDKAISKYKKGSN